MNPHYEKYCSDCQKFGYQPTMTENELLKAWGLKEDDGFKPLTIRPSRFAKPIEAKMEDYDIPKKSKNEKIIKKESTPPKPKAVKAPHKVLNTEQKRERDRLREEKKRRNNGIEARVNLSSLAPEEKRAHRAKLQQARRLNNPDKYRSKDRKVDSERCKQYYQQNREKRCEYARLRRLELKKEKL